MPLRWAYVATLAAGVLVWVVADRVIDTTCALARIAVAKIPASRRPSMAALTTQITPAPTAPAPTDDDSMATA